jgi:hypothetical protein
LVYVKRYKTLLYIDLALNLLRKFEEDKDLLPEISIRNINEYLKEGCGIIAPVCAVVLFSINIILHSSSEETLCLFLL